MKEGEAGPWRKRQQRRGDLASGENTNAHVCIFFILPFNADHEM